MILSTGPFFTLICPKFCRRQELVRHQRHPAGRQPTLFAGSRPRGLLLVSKGTGAPVLPQIDPGEPQEDLGRGQQKYHRRGLRRRVMMLV